MANQVAVHAPGLAAAVPFYGRQPDPEDVPGIKASLLLHYAGTDRRINRGIEAFEAALKKASVDYRIYISNCAPAAFAVRGDAGAAGRPVLQQKAGSA